MFPLLILGILVLGGGGFAYYENEKKKAIDARSPSVALKGQLTPQRQVILNGALTSPSITVPQLSDLAVVFNSQGLPDQAALLLKKAGLALPIPTPANPNPGPLTANPNAGKPINLGNPNPLTVPVPVVLPLSILQIQQILNSAGTTPRLVEDGLPGPDTNSAILNFQSTHGIVEGPASRSAGGNVASVGPKTNLALREIQVNPIAAAASQAATTNQSILTNPLLTDAQRDATNAAIQAATDIEAQLLKNTTGA